MGPFPAVRRVPPVSLAPGFLIKARSCSGEGHVASCELPGRFPLPVGVLPGQITVSIGARSSRLSQSGLTRQLRLRLEGFALPLVTCPGSDLLFGIGLPPQYGRSFANLQPAPPASRRQSAFTHI